MKHRLFYFLRKYLLWLLLAWVSTPLGFSMLYFVQGKAKEFSQSGALLIAFCVCAFPLIQYVKRQTEKFIYEAQIGTAREQALDLSAFNLEMILALRETFMRQDSTRNTALEEQMERVKLKNQKHQLEILSSRLIFARNKIILNDDLERQQFYTYFVEIFLIVIGTFIWGYGADLISWLYK